MQIFCSSLFAALLLQGIYQCSIVCIKLKAHTLYAHMCSTFISENAWLVALFNPACCNLNDFSVRESWTLAKTRGHGWGLRVEVCQQDIYTVLCGARASNIIVEAGEHTKQGQEKQHN